MRALCIIETTAARAKQLKTPRRAARAHGISPYMYICIHEIPRAPAELGSLARFCNKTRNWLTEFGGAVGGQKLNRYNCRSAAAARGYIVIAFIKGIPASRGAL